MIKVLLVDDQQILAEGIKSVLQTSSELSVVGIASDGLRAVDACMQLKPDVVLMDIRMPNMNGVVATKRIKEIDDNIKIIVLTTFDDSDYILSAINNGASGYLLKDIGATALIDAIKNAYNGDTILPAKIAKKITDAAAMVTNDKEYKLKKAFNLSEREVEIALMLYDGFISSIYLKLGVDGRAAAVEKIRSLS